ncbi:MAG TPA: HEPN domain-containing protein [Candidatus Binatia bacterium]
MEWLNRAVANLERSKADIPLTHVYFEDFCFDAQQAAEKAIKAVLLSLGIRFPYIHDLSELLDLVADSGTKIPKGVREAYRLTRFAVVSRYPGVLEPITRNEHLKTVRIAEAVVRWAAKVVMKP